MIILSNFVCYSALCDTDCDNAAFGIAGKHPIALGGSSTAVDCQTQCQSEAQCTHFTFISGDNELSIAHGGCFLKSGNSYSGYCITRTGMISGPKNC